MSDCCDILISLAPAYTRAILDGRKTVELRRRRINVSNGSRVWIYSKTPVARIEATAYVHEIHENHPNVLWSDFGNAAGISKAEFDRYFKGCTRGSAMLLERISALAPGIDLATMRSEVAGFHPPQFFKRLDRVETNAMIQTRTGTLIATLGVPGLGRYGEGGVQPRPTRQRVCKISTTSEA
jgi:predicted transcriptional regulator